MTRSERVSKMVGSRNAKSGIRIENKRVKKSKISLAKRQLFFIVCMLFLFMLSGIGYVWSNFERTQIGYDMSQLKSKELSLKEVNTKLRLELASLKSPQNLEAVALRKLGLKQPSAEQIVVLP